MSDKFRTHNTELSVNAASHESNLVTWLAEVLADVLGRSVSAVSTKDRLRDQGLDSRGATDLVSRLSKHIGKPLEVILAWQYPTLERLAAHVSSLAPAAATKHRQSTAATPATSSMDESIAIVGMGMRLPEGIERPEALYQALCGRIDAIREVPAERWNAEAWLADDIRAPGKMVTRWGSFVRDVSGFDAPFFSISAKEARQMDPQQRLALECAWEGLEDAGIVPTTLEGTSTGVFMGSMWQEYSRVVEGRPEAIEQHSATGWDGSIISARIAYSLGLTGPALTVNTACSSGLVAVHLACESLRRGESSLALAGGVNLILTPHSTIQMTKFGAMNPDGKCRAFDAGANGYVRGEGCGVVVLRRLSDALRSGDRIYAVLRGTAVNNDGFSNGLTAPNPHAQAAVIRTAWAHAAVNPAEVSYVETHGPGTILGDPMEASALGEVFHPGRTEPLRLGSIKTNLGHLESAAGIVGLMKAALALHKGTLPPNLHFDKPSPHIPFEQLGLEVISRLSSFPDRPVRLAGVSSFGFGGTNAHAALEEAPHRRSVVIPIAAGSEQEVRDKARKMAAELMDCEGDVALNAWVRPSSEIGAFRTVVRGRHPSTIENALRALVRREKTAIRVPERCPRLIFLFTGQGSQWAGMGRDLLADEPVFRDTVLKIDAALREAAGWSVLDELACDPRMARLHRTEVVQGTIFTMQVALARTLQSWGMTPDAVVGQSLGEVAAAVIADALCLEDGIRVLCARSKVTTRAAGQGGMFVIDLSPAAADEALVGTGVTVGVYLSPRQVAITGEETALLAVVAMLLQRGIRAQRIGIHYASHSAAMDPLLPEMSQCLADLRPQSPRLPMWSTVNDAWVKGPLDARYWARNLREPVRLLQAVEALSKDGPFRIVEVGSHGVTHRAVQASLEHAGHGGEAAMVSCWRDEPSRDGLERLASVLWTDGFPIDWEAMRRGGRVPTVRSNGMAVPIVLSGRTREALRANARKLADHVETLNAPNLLDLSFSLALSRTAFAFRASFPVSCGQSGSDVVRALRSIADDGRLPRDVHMTPEGQKHGRLVFLFSGQGSQRVGMGKALCAADPQFERVFCDILAVCNRYVDRSLESVVWAEPNSPNAELLNQTRYTQPALFALEVALARRFLTLGITPDVLLGHSIGEIAAAHIGGVLSLEDAASLVCARGALMQGLATAGGSMASIQASEAEVRHVLDALSSRDRACVDIAALNGPEQTVIGGDVEIVAWVVQALQQSGRLSKTLAVSHAFHSPHMDSMLESFRTVANALTYHAPRIPIVSNVTGRLADSTRGDLVTADYWVRHVRNAVRFSDGISALLESGVTTYLECGPHGVLCGLAEGILEHGAIRVDRIPSLRKDRDESMAFAEALGALHVLGNELDWNAVFEGLGARRVELPTYAFQHQRYWLDESPSVAPARPANMATNGHPLVVARVDSPDGRVLFSCRLALDTAPWVVEHQVFETVVLPGVAFAELALHAAHGLGLDRIAELVLEKPLTLPPGSAQQVLLTVEPSVGEERTFTVHSRVNDLSPWVHHVSGRLGNASRAASAAPNWPPLAKTIAMDGIYDRIASIGLAYGPTFRALRRVFRTDTEVFAEVALGSPAPPGDFAIHPVLFDSALHTLYVAPDAKLVLPFAMDDVTLFASGATSLRVRLSLHQNGASSGAVEGCLEAWNEHGQPVFRIGRLVARRALPEQVRQVEHDQHLYQLAWRPQPLPDAVSANEVVLIGNAPQFDGLHRAFESIGVRVVRPYSLDKLASIGPAKHIVVGWENVSEGVSAAAHGAAQDALRHLQTWLALSEPPRLAWLTFGAVAASPSEDVPNLAHAPLWGLARALLSERPHVPFQCIDMDGATSPVDVLRALALVGEQEIALRAGAAFVPRLAPRAQKDRAVINSSFDASLGTVVITGGLGELGSQVARHLVVKHRAKHLVLLSRRGAATPAAQSLVVELTKLGASSVRVEAVDAADASALRNCLAERKDEPAVCLCVHAAGLIDDALLGDMTSEQLHGVLAPKVDAAWNLHEILGERSRNAGLVLFSSLSSLLGAPRNANYAAANAFLDALSHHRNARDLPTISLAWGLWAGGGLGARFSENEHARMRRNGVFPLAIPVGMALLDAALLHGQPLWVPAHLDLPTLAAASAEGRVLPAMFRGLVRPARTTLRLTAAPNSFHADLAARPESERFASVLELVRAEIAVVAGLSGPSDVAVDKNIQDLGFDSLMNVELRNRLAAQIGKPISITASLDYPKPMDLARHLLSDVLGLSGSAPSSPSLSIPRSAADLVLQADPSRWIRSTRPSARVRLFCIPFAGGGASVFHSWRSHVPEHIDLCPVAIPGREARFHETALRDMNTLVHQITDAIEPMLDRPYAIYGHSMGSVVSFEVIRELRRRGARMPERLLIGGYPAPFADEPSPVAHLSGDGMSNDAFVQAVSDEFSAIPPEILESPELLERLVPALRADFHVAGQYKFVADVPLSVPITAFHGREDHFGSYERVAAWRAHTLGEFELHDTSGGHFFHLNPTVPQAIATLLQD